MPRARRAKFDAEFVEQARAFAAQKRLEGRTWDELGEELGVLGETLRRWCVDRKDAVPAMRAIEIVAPGPPTVAATVVSPSGMRVEGLSVQDVIVLLRALG